jgi:hypothetical protein
LRLIRPTGACHKRLLFEEFERLGVAAALKEVAELRVDLAREGLFEAVDFFGDFAEAGGVAVGIAAACFVADDGEAFAEGGGEVDQGGVHRKSLKRAGVWRKRPL